MEPSRPSARQNRNVPPGTNTPRDYRYVAGANQRAPAHRLLAPRPRTRVLHRRNRSDSAMSSPERGPSFTLRVPSQLWLRASNRSEGYLADDSERDAEETVPRGPRRSDSQSNATRQGGSTTPLGPPPAYTGPVTPPRPTSYGLDEDFARAERIRAERNTLPYIIQYRDARSYLGATPSPEAAAYVAQARVDDEGNASRPENVRNLPLGPGETDASYWRRITRARLGVRGAGNPGGHVRSVSMSDFLNGLGQESAMRNGVNCYSGSRRGLPENQSGYDADVD